MNANLYAPATVRVPQLSSFRENVVPNVMTIVGSRVLHLPGRQAGRGIRVLEGTLWITEEGDTNDFLVSAGETFRAAGRGAIVFQSLTPLTRFVFTTPGA